MSDVRLATPYFTLDTAFVRRQLEVFSDMFPGAAIRYPVKCNPHPAILREVLAAGGGFEVASLVELEQVLALGTCPDRILYGHPVKTASAISRASELGVTVFVADSVAEIERIAAAAPGTSVLVRIALDDPSSMTKLGRKFGAELDDVPELLSKVQAHQLQPTGLMFHVGSQCVRPDAWATAIDRLGGVTRALPTALRPTVIDIGGGFPHCYGEPVPSLDEIGEACRRAVAKLEFPIDLIVEPGRALVAGSSTLNCSVVARHSRGSAEWVFIDAGIWHGLSEAVIADQPIQYPMRRLGDGNSRDTQAFLIGGPTCDSLDVLTGSVELPSSLSVGDELVIESVGAYGWALATSFNGFEVPRVLVVE